MNKLLSLLRFAVRGLAVSVAVSAFAATPAPFGTGPGAFPVAGGIYEVSPEYFPHHSLNELTARLPRLEKLGISTLYLTPIFQCAGKAQYLILNYYEINPRYGTEADLRELVRSAHAHHIKVLLDLETSLTTEGSFVMTRHPEWLLHGDDGKAQHFYPFPTWGWALDDTNAAVIDHYSRIARYYVEKFDTDGWRIDSPMNNFDPAKVSTDHSRMQLLRSAKTAVTQAKKDAVFMAEITGPEVLWGRDDTHAQPLFDEMCEASYNYPFCGFLGIDKKTGGAYATFVGSPAYGKLAPTMLNKIAHNGATSREVADAILRQPILNNRLRANFTENHDTERVAKAFPKQHRTLFVLIATMPGVPVVHAGQEIGSLVKPDASGNTDVMVDWAKGDTVLESFYEQVLRIRATHPALTAGTLSDAWKSGDKAVVFQRVMGNDRVLIALNFSETPAHFTAALGLDPKAMYSLRDELGGDGAEAAKTVGGSSLENLQLTLPPYGQRIIAIKP